MRRSSLGLTLALAAAGCELDDPTIATVEDVIRSIALSADTAIADGLARVTVTVELTGIPPANQSVTFSADRGRFLEATAAAPREVAQRAPGRTVFATFVSDTIAGEAAIQATFGDFRVMKPLRLTPMLPDRILVSANVSQAAVGNSATVQVRLLPKPLSAVTRGQFVHLDVRDSTGLSLYEFSTVMTYKGESSLNHVVSARAAGPISVTARMNVGGTEVIGGPISIRFTPAPPSNGRIRGDPPP